jgi:hypothetical protein
MLLKNYYLYADHVELELPDGNFTTIYFTEASGTIRWRYKIDKIIGTKTPHPGICFGEDIHGNEYYMHNHYETGKPVIVSASVFALGQPVYHATGPAINPPLEILRKGLDQIISGEPYNAVNYNCQSFVNRATSNINFSESVQKVFGAFVFGGLMLLG